VLDECLPDGPDEHEERPDDERVDVQAFDGLEQEQDAPDEEQDVAEDAETQVYSLVLVEELPQGALVHDGRPRLVVVSRRAGLN
jgi:hypothetical protein